MSLGPVERREAKAWLAGEQNVFIPDHVKEFLKEKDEAAKQAVANRDALHSAFVAESEMNGTLRDCLQDAINVVTDALSEEPEWKRKAQDFLDMFKPKEERVDPQGE